MTKTKLLRSSTLSIFCLAFSTTAALNAATVSVPYSNDFSSSVADFTENNDPNWTLDTGAETYEFNTGSSNTSGSAMVSASGFGATYADFVVSTTFRVTDNASTGTSNWGMALLGNSESPSTYILADLTSGGGFRLINVGGSGTGQDVDASGAFSFNENTSYTLTATGTYTGTNLTLSLDITDGVSSNSISAAAFDVSTYYTGSAMGMRARSGSGSGSNAGTSVEYDSFSIVPEPGTYALLAGFCMLGFAMLRRL